jgi:hypothetical protein
MEMLPPKKLWSQNQADANRMEEGRFASTHSMKHRHISGFFPFLLVLFDPNASVLRRGRLALFPILDKLE